MEINVIFIMNSLLLGIGLAMDAFSVSLANGLNEPQMRRGKMCFVAGVFAFFQALMPMFGWICIHTIINCFKSFDELIPWIALILLSYIGGKMLYDGIKGGQDDNTFNSVTISALIVQGIATSIDALSVGFTIAEYRLIPAMICALIIAAVTFVICYIGIIIGRSVGVRLAGKAGIFGGIILILIGLEIFITGVF